MSLKKVCFLTFLLEYAHSPSSIIKILVFQSAPVADKQSMRIVLRPWHILNLSHGDDRAFHVTSPALNHLCPEILELSGMLIQLDGVANDGADRRG